MKKTLLLGLLFSISHCLLAQTKSELTLSGNFVTISELRQGYKTIIPETAEPAFVISQRSRLILDYKNDKFDMRFSVQDARAWGETFISNSTKALLLYEAWIKYKLNPDYSLTLGRQSIKYGDMRIFTDRNWSMVGSAHDAAIFNFKKNDLYVDFGLSINNNKPGILVASPYLIKQYQSMSWLWASKTFSPQIKLNFINTLVGYQKPGVLTTYGLNTIGLNPILKSYGFEMNSAAYFQFGKNGTGNEHKAHIYTANLSYTYQFFSAKAGYDQYSGKDYDDVSGIDRDFVQIIETIPHSFLGFMDFVKGSQFKKQQGISDINFYLKYGKKTTFTAYFHALSYTKQSGAGLSKKIGNEFDFVITHKFQTNHKLDIGYSFMLPHDDLVLSALGPNTNASFAQWAWVRLVFNPKFL